MVTCSQKKQVFKKQTGHIFLWHASYQLRIYTNPGCHLQKDLRFEPWEGCLYLLLGH